MKEYIFKQYLDNVLEHMEISKKDFFENKSSREVTARRILYYMCSKRGIGDYDIESYITRQGYKISRTAIAKGRKIANETLEKDSDYKYIVKKLQDIEL
jgi:hypothetical protein|tara:strand:+ start:362 stop:658 length:297 start_codon:yes stop_codon:yes gene_type:complete